MQIYHTLGKILPVKQLSVTPQLHLYSYLRRCSPDRHTQQHSGISDELLAIRFNATRLFLW